MGALRGGLLQRVPSGGLAHSLAPRARLRARDLRSRARVVLGSDYPFKLGVDDPVAALEPLALDPATRRRLLADNAREFLGLE